MSLKLSDRSELLKICGDKNLKNYQNLKKEELKNLLEMIETNRENLPERYDGKIKNPRRPRCVLMFNDNKVYSSISETSKFLETYPMQIYVMIARGKGISHLNKICRYYLDTDLN